MNYNNLNNNYNEKNNFNNITIFIKIKYYHY